MNISNIQYISDESGHLTSVIVPIDLWRRIEADQETAYLLQSEKMKQRLLTAKNRQTGIAFEVDEQPKEEAAAVLAEMGLTVSDAVRILLTRVAQDKALPFEMRIPNRLTAETLAKSERGDEVYHAQDANDLFKQLGI